MSNARINLYNCIEFRLSLHMLDDQFLDIVTEDIMKYDGNTGNIHPRWSPSQPDINAPDQHILVYFYWQSHIDPQSVLCCFRNSSRFGKFVVSASKVITISCPSNISPTILCMKCHQNACTKIRYGWLVRLNVTTNLCSECQTLSISTDNDIKDDNDNEYKYQTCHEIMDEYAIKDDPDKFSFPFQLLMHQAFMKHINPSIGSKENMKFKVIKTIGTMAKNLEMYDVLPPVFQRAYEKLLYFVNDIKYDGIIKSAIGVLNSHSNQLIREHKARIVNNQVKYINFESHRKIMHRIISLIDEDFKSVRAWFWHLPQGEDNLIESLFDLMDIMKQLIQYKFKYEMVIDRKFRVKKLPKEIRNNRNWYLAIKSAMKLDCDSTYRLWKTKLNSSSAEKDVTFTLDKNGHDNQTEDDQKEDPKHNVKDGTPDNLLKRPLTIRINNGSKQVTLYWIDVKYECCCITTEHRHKLKKQVTKYIDNYGFGALVFTNGYVEGLNIADDVICMSLTWLKENIPNINEYTRKPLIGIKQQCEDDTDDEHVIAEYFGDDGQDQDDDDDEKYDDDGSSLDGWTHIEDDIENESVDSEDSKNGITSMRNNYKISLFSSFNSNDNRSYVPLPPISNRNGDKYNNCRRSTAYYYDKYEANYNGYDMTDDHSFQIIIKESTLKHKIRRYNGTKINKFEELDEPLFTDQF